MKKTFYKKTFVLILTVLLLFSNYISVFADTIYIGGAGAAGSGVTGDWSITIPSNNSFMALKIGIHERPIGDFAKNGYYNSYPDVKDNYIILVPTNGHKTKSVLTGNTIEFNSPHVVYGGEGGAKSAIWNLFMRNTPTYKGDAKTLIGNTVASDWTSYITTETLNYAGIDNNFLDKSQGKMIVSNELVSGDLKSSQAAIAGMALCQAINDAGGKIDIKQAAKYFTGSTDTQKEYIVIIENVACMMDTANISKGYWWVDNLTALSVSLGQKINPNSYKGSTYDFFTKTLKLVDKGILSVKTGDNKTGFISNNSNKVLRYLFNEWYSPTYNGWWNLNSIASSLYYVRKEYKDFKTEKKLWDREFDTSADGMDMRANAKFGFNVLISFYQQPTPKYNIIEQHVNADTGQLIEEELHQIEEGKDLTVSAKSYDKLKFSYADIDGVKQDATSYTFNNVRDNHSAVFYYNADLLPVLHNVEVRCKLEDKSAFSMLNKTVSHKEIFKYLEINISNNVTEVKNGDYKFSKIKVSTDGGKTWDKTVTDKDISEIITKDTVFQYEYVKDTPPAEKEKPKVTVKWKLGSNEAKIFDRQTLNNGEIFNFLESNISSNILEIKKGAYKYSVLKVSTDDGLTWNTVDYKDIHDSIKTDTIYQYEYISAKEETKPKASLTMSASPSAIETGSTADVTYTLDASASTGDIAEYQFFIGNSKSEVEKKTTPDIVITSDKWVKKLIGISPNTTKYGKVTVKDKKGQTDTAYAQVTVGEVSKADEPIDIKANLAIDTNDSRVIDKHSWTIDYEDENGDIQQKIWTHHITVEVTPEEAAQGKIDLEVIFNAKGSDSTNGIGKYLYRYGTVNYSSGDKTFTDTKDLSRMTVEDIKITDTKGDLLDRQELTVILTVNDSVKTDETAQSSQLNMFIDFVKTKVPPKVSIDCAKPKVIIGTEQYFSVGYTENEDTFPITDKAYEIIHISTGKVIESGAGEIPQTVLIDGKYSDLGKFEAVQYIYYTDDNGETHKDSDKVQFRVIEPIPTAKITAYMATELTNGTITKQKEITNNIDKGKQYKQIIISLAGSEAATEEIIQKTYPILWDKAVFTLVKMTSDYGQDLSGNDKIHTYNSTDKTVNADNLITITGKKELSFRFDDYGTYQIRAKVANAARESIWVTAYITISEDTQPEITDFVIEGPVFNIETQTLTAYRNDNNNLATKLNIKANIFSYDGDYIDLDKIKLYAVYDLDQDKSFTNNTEKSYTRLINTLDSFMSVQPIYNPLNNSSYININIELTIDSTDINYLGLYKFELEAWEKPEIPDFTGGSFPEIPERKATTRLTVKDKDKIVEIVNYAPTIELQAGKEPTAEVRILHYGEPTFNYDVMDEWNVTKTVIDGKQVIESESNTDSGGSNTIDSKLPEWFTVDLENEYITSKYPIIYYDFDESGNRYFMTNKNEDVYFLKTTDNYELEYAKKVDTPKYSMDTYLNRIDNNIYWFGGDYHIKKQGFAVTYEYYVYNLFTGEIVIHKEDTFSFDYPNDSIHFIEDNKRVHFVADGGDLEQAMVIDMSDGQADYYEAHYDSSPLEYETISCSHENTFTIAYNSQEDGLCWTGSEYVEDVYSEYFSEAETLDGDCRCSVTSDHEYEHWEDKITTIPTDRTKWTFTDLNFLACAFSKGYNKVTFALTDDKLKRAVNSKLHLDKDLYHFWNMQLLNNNTCDMKLYTIGDIPEIINLTIDKPYAGENTSVTISGKAQMPMYLYCKDITSTKGEYKTDYLSRTQAKISLYIEESTTDCDCGEDDDCPHGDEDYCTTKIKTYSLNFNYPVNITLTSFLPSKCYNYSSYKTPVITYNASKTQYSIKLETYGCREEWAEFNVTAVNTNSTQAAEKVSYILNDTETPLEIGENGLFNFTVNTNELKSIGKIPVIIKAEKHGLTSQSIINIEYYQILTKLYSLLNLGQSNSGLVVILDNTEVTIDNNTANQKLIDKIIHSANEYNSGLYVIDTGNEAMQELAERIIE